MSSDFGRSGMEGLELDNFDEFQWINEKIDLNSRNAKRDLTRLISQLQQNSTQSHSNVSKSFTKVASVNFKNIRDVETASGKLKSLQRDLVEVSATVRQLQQRIQDTTEVLKKLSAARDRISVVMDSVEIALKVSRDMQGIEGTFIEVNDLMGLSRTIREMRLEVEKLMKLIASVGGSKLDNNDLFFVRKLLQVEKRIEQDSMPSLAEALSRRDTASTITNLEIFRNIGLETDFIDFFIEKRRSEMVENWQKIDSTIKSEIGSTDGSLKRSWSIMDIESALHMFFTDLARFALVETQFLSRVLEDVEYSRRIVTESTTMALKSTTSEISSIIGRALSDPSLASEERIIQVMKLYDIHLKFLSETKKHSLCREDLEEYVMSPFVEYKMQYGSMESTKLKSEIKKSIASGRPDDNELESCFKESERFSKAVPEISKNALDRCIKFTKCAEIGGLCSAFNAMISVISGRTRSSIAKINSTETTIDHDTTWKNIDSAFHLMKVAKGFLNTILDFDSQFVRAAKSNLEYALEERYVKNSRSKTANLKEFVSLLDAKNPLHQSIQMMDSVCELIEKLLINLMRNITEGEIKGYGKKKTWVPELLKMSEVVPFSLSTSVEISKSGDTFLDLAEHLENMSAENPEISAVLPSFSQSEKGGFCIQWLLRVSGHFIKVFKEEVRAIERIDGRGFYQLETDISNTSRCISPPLSYTIMIKYPDYISNILSALGITFSPVELSIEEMIQRSNVSLYNQWIQEKE